MFHASVDHRGSNLHLVSLQTVRTQSLPEPGDNDSSIVQPDDVVLSPETGHVKTDLPLLQPGLETGQVVLNQPVHPLQRLLAQGGGEGIGHVLQGVTSPGPLQVYQEERLVCLLDGGVRGVSGKEEIPSLGVSVYPSVGPGLRQSVQLLRPLGQLGSELPDLRVEGAQLGESVQEGIPSLFSRSNLWIIR